MERAASIFLASTLLQGPQRATPAVSPSLLCVMCNVIVLFAVFSLLKHDEKYIQFITYRAMYIPLQSFSNKEKTKRTCTAW